MASLPPLTVTGRVVLHAAAAAFGAVWPFVLTAVVTVPLCSCGVLLLGEVTVDYGPVVGMQVAAIAAEAVVIIPAHVGLGCWLCDRINAKTHRARMRALHRADTRAHTTYLPRHSVDSTSPRGQR